jgi:16S rRNA (uracil1498-N3)-methyltransferase
VVVHSWGTFVYAPPECVQKRIITLPRDEAHHLHHVLRMKPGQTVYATNGEGTVYHCTILDDFDLQIDETLPEFGETAKKISIAVGILKGDGNRDIVDLATQLGARRILFINAARSEGQVSLNKLERLQRTAVSAMKQCGRARLPEIIVFESVQEMLAGFDPSTTLFLAQQTHADDRQREANRVGSDDSEMLICVGPEGGFDDEEIQLFEAADAQSVSLAGRRLRTAVAAGAALSFCLNLIGEAKQI